MLNIRRSRSVVTHDLAVAARLNAHVVAVEQVDAAFLARARAAGADARHEPASSRQQECAARARVHILVVQMLSDCKA